MGDDWTKTAKLLEDKCATNASLNGCLLAISDTKNTEIISGIPVTWGNAASIAANTAVPGAGAAVEGAGAAIDQAA